MTAGRPRVSERGFILPLSLLAVSVVAVAIWSAASVLDSAGKTLRDVNQRRVLQLAGASTEARIGFLLATEPLGPFGLRIDGRRISAEEEFGAAPVELAPSQLSNEKLLQLDGRAYRFSPLRSDRDLGGWTGSDRATSGPEVIVTLQDRGGLFNLNPEDAMGTERMLRSLDTGEAAARRLADVLADFVDPDDLIRLNGAEKADYKNADLPPPRNRPIEAPAQALEAFGWRQTLTAAQVRNFLAMSYVAPVTEPKNLNTAPASVLRSWFGLDDGSAQRMIELRETGMVLTADSLAGLIGVSASSADMVTMSFPSRFVVVQVASPQAPGAIYTSVVELGAGGALRPFFVTDRSIKVGPEATARAWLGRSAPAGSDSRGKTRSMGDDLPELPVSQSVLSFRTGLAPKP